MKVLVGRRLEVRLDEKAPRRASLCGPGASLDERFGGRLSGMGQSTSGLRRRILPRCAVTPASELGGHSMSDALRGAMRDSSPRVNATPVTFTTSLTLLPESDVKRL